MTLPNPIATTPDERFVVGESDFAYFSERPSRSESCALLYCRGGEAEVTVNGYRDRVRQNTLVFILAGWLVAFSGRSADFRVGYCAFSEELFAEAAFRIDHEFFRSIYDRPVFTPPARIAEGAETWLQMAAFTYRDRENIFRDTIIRNRLQNLLLEVYDKYRRFAMQRAHASEATTRQEELFHRFAAQVHEHCMRQREVTFYADALCISTRYLSAVVRTMTGGSAKAFIDRQVVQEIRILLQSTDLSVQEIAYRLHFPDQSYLGRFFRKRTGQSPTEYRNARGRK